MSRQNDATDRRLLALLQANARASTTEIGRKLGLARTTIQERISRLERNGTISGYSAVLRRDPNESRTEVLAFLTASYRKRSLLLARLKDIPEVRLCQLVNGPYDIVCRIWVPQLEDIPPVLETIAALDGVEGISSMIVLSTQFDRLGLEVESLAAFQAKTVSNGEIG